MQTITLHLPERIKTEELRADLEEIIISDYRGRSTTYFAFPLPYAVGLAQIYELPAKGTIVTVTNDANVFMEDAPEVPGGAIWYTARILLLGFNESTQQFEWMKQSFEYLNNKYRRDKFNFEY